VTVIVRPGDSLRITARALSDLSWMHEPPTGSVGQAILSWLRDEAAQVQEILDSFDESAQDILDAAGVLVERGLIEVVNDDPAPKRCDLAADVHTVPQQRA
jgi:hypothetical protein